MSEFADLEFGNAEGVAVVGGDQGAGEFVDLGGGVGTDGVGEGLSRANFLGGERGRGHKKASVAGTHCSPRQRTLPWCTRIPPTYKTLTGCGIRHSSIAPRGCYEAYNLTRVSDPHCARVRPTW